MPIYCYACSECEADFEQILRMSQMADPLSQPCPECGAEGGVVQQCTAASFGNPFTMGNIKTPAGFTQVLDRINKNAGVKHRKTRFSETREV